MQASGRCTPTTAAAIEAGEEFAETPAGSPTASCALARTDPCDFTDAVVTETQNPRDAVWAWRSGSWQRSTYAWTARRVSLFGESGGAQWATISTVTPHADGRRALQVIAGTSGSRRPTRVELLVRMTQPLCNESRHPVVRVRGPGVSREVYRGRALVDRAISFDAIADTGDQSAAASFFARFSPLLLQPTEYTIQIETCGVRRTGAPVGTHEFKVLAYPGYQCGIKIGIPSMHRRTYRREATRGLTEDTDTTRRTTTDRRSGTSTESETSSRRGLLDSEDRSSSSTTRRGSSVSDTDSTAFEREGSTTTRRSDAFGGDSTSTHDDYAFGSDRRGTRTTVTTDETGGIEIEDEPIALSDTVTFEVKLDSQDVNIAASLTRLVDSIRRIGVALNDIVENIHDVVPAIGWSVTWELNFLAGSIEASWRLKEHTDNRVFVNYTATVAVSLVQGSFELTFGLRSPLFTAEVFGRAEGEISCRGTVSHDNADGGLADSFSITLNGSLDGTIGARVLVGPESLRIFEAEGGLRCGLSAEGGFRVNRERGPHLLYNIKWKAGVLYYQMRGADGTLSGGDEYQVWEEVPLVEGTLPPEH